MFKLLLEEGFQQELLTNKYLRGKMLSQAQAKANDSPFRKELMGAKNDFFQHGSFVIGDGLGTCFWEDIWLGNTSLATWYPTLYNIIRTKNVLVADVLNKTPLNIRFKSTGMGEMGCLDTTCV
jgi:hypothetical protein